MIDLSAIALSALSIALSAAAVTRYWLLGSSPPTQQRKK